MTDVGAVGINKFIVNDADFSVIGLRFKLDLTIPDLLINGQFLGSGMVGGLFALDGSGPFKYITVDSLNIRAIKCFLSSLDVIGAHVRVDGQLQYAASIGWTVAELAIKCRIDESKVLFTGLKKGEDFFNEIMSATGAEMFDEIWIMMEPMVTEQVQNMILESLNDMTLLELMALLTGDPADLFPPVVPLT